MNAVREMSFREPTGIAPKKRKISPSKLDLAAQNLGMISINSRKIRDYSTLGLFLEQRGVLEVSTGKLLASADALVRTIDSCAEIITNRDLPLDVRRSFMNTQLEFVKALDANSVEIIKAHCTEALQRPTNGSVVRSFAVGQPVSPIQININAEDVSKQSKPE